MWYYIVALPYGIVTKINQMRSGMSCGIIGENVCGISRDLWCNLCVIKIFESAVYGYFLFLAQTETHLRYADDDRITPNPKTKACETPFTNRIFLIKESL